jgi:hypothetical protein
MKKIIIAIALSGLGSAAAGDQSSPKRADSSEQIRLADAFNSDAAELHTIKTDLKLSVPFDVSSAFDSGTLVVEAKALEPLLASQRSPQSPGDIMKHPKAFVATATIWNSKTENVVATPDGLLTLPVCWQNASPENARGRAITQQAVEATWEYHGLVRFDWSDSCRSSTVGIKIFVEDGRPWSYYGIQSQFPGQSMSLNFTFNDSQMSGCKPTADLCIWSIAVHEFGHALGFIHEQDSPDAPEWCKKKLNPSDIQRPDETLKAKMLTDWDEYSVMDYCFDIYKDRIQLSDCDIAAYRKEYGTPASPSFVPKCPLKELSNVLP